MAETTSSYDAAIKIAQRSIEIADQFLARKVSAKTAAERVHLAEWERRYEIGASGSPSEHFVRNAKNNVFVALNLAKMKHEGTIQENVVRILERVLSSDGEELPRMLSIVGLMRAAESLGVDLNSVKGIPQEARDLLDEARTEEIKQDISLAKLSIKTKLEKAYCYLAGDPESDFWRSMQDRVGEGKTFRSAALARTGTVRDAAQFITDTLDDVAEQEGSAKAMLDDKWRDSCDRLKVQDPSVQNILNCFGLYAIYRNLKLIPPHDTPAPELVALVDKEVALMPTPKRTR